MSDQGPSLQIDSDWKKQAQEEKRRLAEQEKAAPPAASAAPAAGASDPRAGVPGTAGGRELPSASVSTLVQSVVTQALYHLGELSSRGDEPVVNLDMAKHHVDTLGVIEEKMAGNLTADEKKMLDSALYEARMRYVSVASQYIS